MSTQKTRQPRFIAALVSLATLLMSQGPAVSVDGGPEDDASAEGSRRIVLEAAEQLRLRELAKAQAMLETLCPGGLDKAVKGAKKKRLPCQLIVASEAEKSGTRPPDRISLLYWSVADDARKAGDLNVAQSLFKVAIDRDPKEFENWYSLAIVERGMSAFPDSNASFRKALEIRPGDPTATYWMATNLMDDRKFDEAGALLDGLLQKDPSDGRAWYRRGEVFCRQGQSTEAIKHFEKAASLGVDQKKVEQRMKECSPSPNR